MIKLPWLLLGGAAWTAGEYAIHRFVGHGPKRALRIVVHKLELAAERALHHGRRQRERRHDCPDLLQRAVPCAVPAAIVRAYAV